MLIDLRSLCNKYKFLPKGIIHVGAHKGEELTTYEDLGIENVIWIEANPKIFESLNENIKKFKNHKAYNFLVSDKNDEEYIFHVTNNGESSSILELERHKIHHSHIHVVEDIVLKSKKMDFNVTVVVFKSEFLIECKDSKKILVFAILSKANSKFIN